MADEARSLQYSINVSANTGQAESSIRNLTSSLGGLQGSGARITIGADVSDAEQSIRGVTSSLGGVQTQASSVSAAFRSSFLQGIDSGDSFASSLKAGVGGAISHVTGKIGDFKNSVTSTANTIKDSFTHPISTIKTGLGNAVQGVKDKFIAMARGADQAADGTEDVSKAAGNAKKNVSELGDAADESGGKLEGLGNIMKGVGAGIAAFSTAAVAGAVALGKAVVESYAEFEQLVGGIDTLFGDASQTVQNFANNAYATAGMSANSYMELVTSFSASMISALGGDTMAAAAAADSAITDMADNANKMGTSLELIQNAYRGFSMGNYTMLDNLKLGYSGTQEEMQRLLNDAQKISGVKYDISNFADVTAAIHVIQEEMGIAGATAEEAAGTISGSWASTKAAFANLITGLGDANADVGALTDNVVESFGNVINNVLPVVQTIVTKVPDVLGALLPAIGSLLPELLGVVGDLFEEVLTTLVGLLPSLIPVALGAVTTIAGALVENLPVILDAGMQLVSGLFDAIVESLPMIAEAAVQMIGTLVSGLGAALPDIIPAAIDAIVTLVGTLIENLPMILDAGMQLLQGLAQGIMDSIPLLIEQLPALISQIVGFVSENLPTILEQGVTILTELAMGIVNSIPLLLEQLPMIIETIVGFVTENLPVIVEAGINLLLNLTTGIIQAIPQLLEQLPQIITSITGTITENLPLIIEMGVNLLLQLASGIISAIPQLVAQLPQIISAIVSGIGAGISSIVDIGKSIVEGVWNGISAMGAWIKEKVSGFFGGIVDSVKGLLGINSPSKVFAEIGDNMALGVGKGFDETMPGVNKDIEDALPTEFDLPSVNAPDVTGGTNDVSYQVNPVVETPNLPTVSDVSYGVNPVVADFTPPDTSANVVYDPNVPDPSVSGPSVPDPATGGGDSVPAPFAPVIHIHVEGNADEQAIDNMSGSLYETVRRLFEEFREEELERMSLKNQYAF